MFAGMTIKDAGKICFDTLTVLYPEGETLAIGEIVLEYVSQKSRNELRLFADHQLSPEDELLLQNILERLKQFEPVQYIINEAWFYAMPFYVDRNVLIPRPETEELVHWIITDYVKSNSSLRILDIGTGSGCIPISLKRKFPGAEVWACDINEAALNVAKRNAKMNEATINLIKLDFLNPEQWRTLPVFDIIVSNPPYIPESDKPTIPANVLGFEPHQALFVPDNDPLVFYNAIAAFAKTNLTANGHIYAELHEYLGDDVSSLFIKNGLSPELRKDMQQKDRMIKCSLRP